MLWFLKLLWRPWRLYADFSGRSRRLEYWLFLGIRYAVIVAAYLAMPKDPTTGEIDRDAVSGWLSLFFLAWFLGTVIPAFAVTGRRLHDANFSGKWLGATLIPYIGILAVLVIGLLPGTHGENDEGFDPRLPESTDGLEATFS